MKNLRRLLCKIDFDYHERKSTQVENRPKFSICVYLRVSLAKAEVLIRLLCYPY